jgi:tripartite-type tricarboxylate transporter receptor subunit TctC
VICASLGLAIAVAFLPVAGHAGEPPFPARPVRLVVPFAPGAAQDLLGRLIAQQLGDAYGQTFVVGNRPGAGSSIGADIVAKSPADGHTLLLANEALAINAALQPRLPFRADRDLTPIALVVTTPRVFVAGPGTPGETLKDLLATARAKPGAVRYGSSGVGTGGHLAGALMASMGKVEMTHVPYKGAAPAITDVMGGRTEIVAATILTVQPLIQAGRLRPLAVTAPKRSAALPSVPTVAESGLPGYEAIAWSMLMTPSGSPDQVVQSLYRRLAGALGTAEVRKRLAADGADPSGAGPAETARYLRTELTRWRSVVQEARLRAD